MRILQCFRCVHRRDTPGPVLTCDAFPDGVPEAIQLQDHDHSEPFPGDRGIRFERVNYDAILAAKRAASHSQGP